MTNRKELMWCSLLHLSTNLWYEEGNTHCDCTRTWKSPAQPEIRFDRAVWDRHIEKLKESGANTIILDTCDAIRYKSHPEIAVRGAWSREETEEELKRLNAMGFQVIPKLNFSTCHDTWMKQYSLMVSTPEYYQFCRDVIEETAEIFKPEYIHLGMDEEVYENQKDYNYVAIRQNELWWHDLYYLIDCVEKNGARAMIWSDYARHKPDEFIQKCPKSVVQCVWYYFNSFEGELDEVCKCRVMPYKILSDAGFDLLPTGSVEFFDDNLQNLTKYCLKTVSCDRLLGFVQTTWAAVTSEWEPMLDKSAESLENSKKLYYDKFR